MKSEKKLYLHIGCGKTGSSALQLWLHQNRSVLQQHGIDYPEEKDGNNTPGDYQITSGNGSLLIDRLEKKSHERYLKSLFQRYSTLLFSSELFQGIGGGMLDQLVESSIKLGFHMTIIVYLRDVYDVIYSLYVQRVKRHLETRTFEEFALELKVLQQFHVLSRYEKYFDDLRVIHYDTELERGIDRIFAEILGLDQEIPGMTSRKVNRSLNVFELELLRQMNRIYIEKFGGEDSEFSREISDRLIYVDPEKPTEIYFQKDLAEKLQKKFLKPLRRVNKKYFDDNRLKFFRRKEKRVVRTVPKVPREYFVAVESIMKYFLDAKKKRKSWLSFIS